MGKLPAIGIAVPVLLLLAAFTNSCGGSIQASPAAGATLSVLDGAGRKLPASAARLVAVTGGYAVYAQSADALGFVLAYPTSAHAINVERGSYFAAGDPYLAYSALPGRVDIGGYRLGGLAATVPGGNLVATVTLAPGAVRGVRAVLPTSASCVASAFRYSDDLDGTATFDWTYRNTGDYNQDGQVTISDLTPIGVHFGVRSIDLSWPSASLADGDGNGEVNIADITPIGVHYLTTLSGYKLETATTASGPFSEEASFNLADGTASPALDFSYRDTHPHTGAWYSRVRAFSLADPTSGAATAALQISLLPPGNPPTPAFTFSPPSPQTGDAVQFTDSTSGAPTSWSWTFGDGGTSTAQSPSYAYPNAGTFTITLTASNMYGSNSTSQQITVAAKPVPDDPSKTFVAVSSATLNGAGTAFTIHSSDLPDNSQILYGPLTQGGPPVDNNLNITYPYRGGLNDPASPHPDIHSALGAIGMTVAGLVIYGPSNASTITVSGTKWTYDANSARINGEDAYGGHASPVNGGQYHYHDVSFISHNSWVGVTGFNGSYVHADGHSKLVGWAEDGYPIYGPYGYVDPLDPSSGVERMTPSWQANNSGANRPPAVTTSTASATSNSTYIVLGSDPGALGINPGMHITLIDGAAPPQDFYVVNQKNVTYVGGGHPPYTGPNNSVEVNIPVTIASGANLKFEFLPGVFIEDEVYIGGGTLDRYNGRWCKTPDFPAGTYAYFCTMDLKGDGIYPYMIGPELYGSTSVGTTPGTGYVKPTS